MTRHTPRELFEKNLINEDQFKRIEQIVSGIVVSVFYELKTLLYLGVMLFTTGAGILVYQNIGELGHLFSILILTLIMIAGFIYAIKRGADYSNHKVKSPSAYFDYILLLACLLFVTIQGYIQFQFESFTESLEWNTLLTSILFFYVAYRYDHLGVLSLAITAFASFWGLRVSTQKWYSGDFFEHSDLHITAIVFALTIASIVFYIDKKDIKRHFTFTYFNFCLLLYFIGALTGIFTDDDYDLVFILLIYAGSAFAWFQSQTNKSYLFLLYAFVAAYIATTYLLGQYVFENEPSLWYFYFIISCGGVIFLIMRYKKLFKR